MRNEHRSDDGEFSSTEGLALALNYLSDPADVPCPTCGPGTMEVVAYLDADRIRDGVVRASDPTGEYTVVLYCHECRRAGALDLTPDGLREPEEGEQTDADPGEADEPGGGSSRWAA